MNISRPFILRPVATWLLSLSLMAMGVIGFRLLPVAPLPQVSFPVIIVRASIPGANPETMAATVATPLERAFGEIAGVNEMSSTSSQGSTRIFLQFDLDRDINGAARDVQAAINASRSLLPSSMRTLPSYFKANSAAAPVLMLSLTSNELSTGQMYDLASSQLEQRIAQVKGVGEVNLYGASLPAVRIDLHPQALTHYGISLDTVRQKIVGATNVYPKGVIQGNRFAWMINSNGQLTKASQYRPLIIAYKNGAAIRLKDVANVYDSVQNRFNVGYYNNQPSINIGITLAAGANMLSTIDAIKSKLPMFHKILPGDVQLHTTLDRSPTIRSSLHETERTLIIAVSLVIAVVFLFLRNGRALLIPAVALPLSLVGTFAVMYLLGYSLDNFSLMALIVATGFVVDDAIVVLENISRHLEDGYGPIRASLRGAKEVGFTVLSMTLSLIAVFIPLLLMGGIIGRLFREFAVTLTVSLLISMLISLTLTPMLCSRMLRRRQQGCAQPRLYQWIERGFNGMQWIYQRGLRWCLKHRRITLLSLLVTIGLNFYLFAVVPKGFFPTQDTGMIWGELSADQSTSFAQMKPRLRRYTALILSDPAVASVMSSVSSSGRGGSNSGRFFVRLKPLSQRKASASEVANRLYAKSKKMAGGDLFLMAVSDIMFGGRDSNASYQLSLQSDSLTRLRQWAPKVRAALAKLPQLSGVDSNQQTGGQQIKLVIDRAAAKRLGVSVRDIDAFLNNSFSQRQIANIYEPLNQYSVVMGLTSDYTDNSDVLNHLKIVNSDGKVIPIKDFVSLTSSNAPLSVHHEGHAATITVSFNTADGVTFQAAQQAIKTAIAKLGMPSDVVADFAGNAMLFNQFVGNIPWLLLAALAAVYIVLGVLYESYIHPLTILSTLPSAGVGALLLMEMTGTPLTVVALIGILLLIGVVKKNAIMMIDFALAAQRQQNLSPEEAIYEACCQRFRPILMTSLAAFFGALPMAIEHGGDADMRSPLGIAICGGLVLSQLLTLFTTPVVYLYMDKLSFNTRRLWRRIVHREPLSYER
ncbi:efflux RND transporter permease subunit [Celerinatantimonas diazotrophica]|uniref:Multidrug efflux pump n=1 Tax=Celerinatantimonas diazotrophica TaxID=412034 RepID=A0A4V2PNE8_9GAMM|nr:efflux RND transporter permease subunit [Celerinatantimonas diazotrophica]TCK46781.1 multidrug efflux pump [Celerinatantimonas diazotrophica]CAG9295484.1 Multidrug resistance protein MdtC [Celerinatantimonas diazotrophica]